MLRKIDVGVDKNLFIEDPRAKRQPQLKFLADDIPKSPDSALDEVHRAAVPNWINAEPILHGFTDENGTAYLFLISELPKKKVLLLEITDFTLLPCRRSLRYSIEWQKRYGHSGLLVVAVHSPMFEFSKERKVVADAVRAMQITFPVMLDNDFNIWRSFENRCWPRRILFDNKQEVHMDVIGEGDYVQFETKIQQLLRGLSPGLPCPPVLKPLGRIDDPDYAIPETTPEIYFGSQRGLPLGNAQQFKAENEEVAFALDPNTTGSALQNSTPYLQGPWLMGSESVHGSTAHKGDLKVTIRFCATDAYIVARSRAKNPNDLPQGTKITVTMDGRPLPEENITGTDTYLNEVRRTVIMVRDPKLHHIATRLDSGYHDLVLTIDEDTLHTIEVYALFFEHDA